MELSGWWRRVGAALIDGLLIAAVAHLLLWPTGFDLGEYYHAEGSAWLPVSGNDLVYAGISAVLSLVYFTPLMTRWEGRTVGKRATGIRVIRADWQALDAGTVIVRQTVLQYMIGAIVVPLTVVDSLLPLVDRQNRAIHDYVCRTRVIRDWPSPATAVHSPEATAPAAK